MRESSQNGVRKQQTVKRIAWASLGFADHMSLEQARARAQQLNQQNAVKRAELMALTRVADRVERDRLHHSAFIPSENNEQFILWLGNNSSGSEKHLERLKSHWATAKRIVIALKLPTEQYAPNAKQIYRYLATQEYSLDYTNKLIGMINRYGRFCSRLTSRFYEDIPHPKGHDREMINDQYFQSSSYYGPSEPLDPDLLESLRSGLSDQQYSWLAVSVWFGLRPSEIDSILLDRQQKCWRVEEGDPEILWVYQAKLSSKPRAKRWKPIPVLFAEQRNLLTVLNTGQLQKPLSRKLKKLTGEQVTLYAGRKGFTDLMLARGQRLEDIAQWLGHSSIEMTWSRYKDKNKVGFTLVGEKA